MRLYVEHEYFEAIRQGEKKTEYREAHITFADKKTRELLEVPVIKTRLIPRKELPSKLKGKSFLNGKYFIAFDLGGIKEYPNPSKCKKTIDDKTVEKVTVEFLNILLEGAEIAKKLLKQMNDKKLYESYTGFRLVGKSLKYDLIKSNGKEVEFMLNQIDEYIKKFNKKQMAKE